MRSRFLAAGLGALTLIGLTACGSSDGTGASPLPTTVKLGQTSYVTAAPVITSTTTAATTVPGAVGVVVGEQMYTVVSGDYPIRIAKKHCIDLAALAAYNSWPPAGPAALNVGDAVKIPPGACAPGSQPEVTTAPATEGTASPDPAGTPDSTTTTFDPASGGTYTVLVGDFLTKIAANTGTTVDAIVAANGWSDGANHLIIPGQQIKLPAKTG